MAQYDDLVDYDWLMPHVDFHETEQAHALGVLLYEMFQPKSVIDVGCATGIYLLPFRERGAEVWGIDGAPAGGQWIPDAFELVDLRNPWTPAREYDLCLNIEVAEHLKPQYADGLVKILTSCAPAVFFSAASPGQNGEGHFNCQPELYWTELFAKHGFFRDSGMTEQAHQTIDTAPEFEKCGWLRWHSCIYRRQ